MSMAWGHQAGDTAGGTPGWGHGHGMGTPGWGHRVGHTGVGTPGWGHGDGDTSAEQPQEVAPHVVLHHQVLGTRGQRGGMGTWGWGHQDGEGT